MLDPKLVFVDDDDQDDALFAIVHLLSEKFVFVK